MKRVMAVLVVLAFLLVSCSELKEDGKPYSGELEERVTGALEQGEIFEQDRPDYLPEEMFSLLPAFPKDFYSVRQLVRSGTIVDLGEVGSEYWMQPEFFPNFEEIGLPILQNPPEDRWGAYGYLTYPGDTISIIKPGETLEFYFYVKSSYLVETYQGIMFEPSFPATASVLTGEIGGDTNVEQDPGLAESYFTVEMTPNPFVVEPNFPVFRPGGTARIKVTITASSETPPGNYAISFDATEVPDEQEKEWIRKYLNLYVSGTMTKLSKPYHQAFLIVPEEEVI